MYIQPLITSAFATYTVSPASYRGQSVNTGDDSEADSAAFLAAMANVNGSGSIAPTGGIEKTYETDSIRGGEKTVDPDAARDAGKPKSASGDVLDLSQEAKEVWENRSADRRDAVEDAAAELNRQAEQDTETRTRENARIDSENAEADTESDTLDNRISLDSVSTSAGTSGGSASLESGASELTPEEQEQVEKLKARDAEVRLHEQTHMSVGGPYVTGGPSYTYQTGPDGKKYAIGGEVSIDLGTVSGDPQATIQKMQTVARAALAPAEPSSQDQKVAASARQKEAQARAELNQQNAEEMSGNNSTEEAASGEMAATDETAPPSGAKASNLSRSAAAYQAQNAMSLNSAGSRFSAFA